MNDQTDSQLLHAYAENRSEAAFTELVRRHVDFVYSAARRMVHDPHLAEDVTQGVFVAVAKNARQLTNRAVVSSWLHRTAQNIAAQTVRTIERRRAREQEAVAMNELLAHEPDAVWENVAPHLDKALGELSEPDRDALLLRYFERKSAREMAQALGVSDEAAQKRVNRAVERLRELFSKRNVTIGASGLVVLISANAVQAAPAGLATTIPTSVAAATITIATHTTMQWINLKSAAMILATALAASTVTHLVEQQGANRLRSENQNLADTNRLLSKERDAALSASTANNDELGRLRKEKGELLRLRSEVGMLRKQASELANFKEETLRLRAVSSNPQNKQVIQAQPAGQTNFPKESWAFAGYATPEAALQSWVWAMSKGDKQAMLGSLVPEARKEWEKIFGQTSDSEFAADVAKGFKNIVGYKIVELQASSDSEVELRMEMSTTNEQNNKDKMGKAEKMTLQKVENEWKLAGPSKNQ
ncbi:sigma-70 family RNA polymerase sigma factor [Pedosphaera parvula]|uniref:sigma-70 family RNA polymerase sigma factor n=1 Tax=Pedosphaera parvula TaxID=1032527 RepID=UPI00058E7AE0|nr:sigma-70 family RNA polymerase sigma factor [Pedosphaera parvula]